MVKAIFFDIDGTLVSFQTHTVPESTREALRLLREKGIKVFIATGRPKTLMMDAVGDLDFDGYVTLNGAHCFTANHEDIYKGCVPQEDIERLIQYQHDHPEMPFVFVHDNTWFLTHEDEAVREIARLIQIDIPEIRPIETAREKEILQIMGYFPEEKDEEIFGKVLTPVPLPRKAAAGPRCPVSARVSTRFFLKLPLRKTPARFPLLLYATRPPGPPMPTCGLYPVCRHGGSAHYYLSLP
jgi:hypothetical protein